MQPLSKVDSAISGMSSSPTEEKHFRHRRSSSSVSGVFNILELGMLNHCLMAPALLPSTQAGHISYLKLFYRRRLHLSHEKPLTCHREEWHRA